MAFLQLFGNENKYIGFKLEHSGNCTAQSIRVMDMNDLQGSLSFSHMKVRLIRSRKRS